MTPTEEHFYFDDHDPSRPQIGQRFIDHVREIGPPIICTHKGISSIVGTTPELADPSDIGPAAARNPDISFVIYHSGFEPGMGGVGPYDPADPGRGWRIYLQMFVDAVVAAGGHTHLVVIETPSAPASKPEWAGPMAIMDEASRAMAAQLPQHVTFTQGVEKLTCMSLSGRGMLRWYASCCNTPIGNTARDFKVSHVGLLHNCLQDPSTSLDSAFGPVRMKVGMKSGPRFHDVPPQPNSPPDDVFHVARPHQKAQASFQN